MKYFFIRIRAISLLLAMRTAKTRFFIFEQFCWIAVTIDSRTAAANGKMRTECVKNMNGLFDTEMKEHTTKIINIDAILIINVIFICRAFAFSLLLLHARFWLSFVSK